MRSSCLWLYMFGVERFLLSSRFSVRWRRSCALASVVPSPAACLWPAARSKRHGKLRARWAAMVAAPLKTPLSSWLWFQFRPRTCTNLVLRCTWSSNHVILRAVVRLQCQSAVGPELSLGAEAVRRLHAADQHGGSHLPQKRERIAAISGRVLAALGEHVALGLESQEMHGLKF